MKPRFLITIDTEGDNLWENPQEITTENVKFLPRFQTLCEKYGFQPTWLVNYEMAKSDLFQEFGKDVLSRETGEIGMHLHAWNSPPITDRDLRTQNYLIEYEVSVMREKVAFMTDLLFERFQVPITSHRAGRWAFDERYAKLLVEFGYLVDCSVTPGWSWKEVFGDPNGSGGPDYTEFPHHAYWLNLDDISLEGSSPLLELPVTIIQVREEQYPATWLRPFGTVFKDIHKLVDKAVEEKRTFIEFMIHSSELMPGGSKRFTSSESIELLYENLDRLFEQISHSFQGSTLSKFQMLYKEESFAGHAG